jgi:hypothetical protein
VRSLVPRDLYCTEGISGVLRRSVFLSVDSHDCSYPLTISANPVPIGTNSTRTPRVTTAGQPAYT